MRKAKIMCTIGPASAAPNILDRLIEQGMNAARLNFSHGTHENHAAAIRAIRQSAARQGSAVAIIQDLQGPRIRIDRLPGGPVEMRAGQSVRLTTTLAHSGGQLGAQSLAASPTTDIPVTYPYLARDVRPGARVLINDGLVELTVDRISGGLVECTVLVGGAIGSHKGINLPGTTVSSPTLTDKDRTDLRFGLEQGVDYVALSFVRNSDDLAAARTFAAQWGAPPPLIAKIERQEAITNLDAILEEADGVMIARGDLGVELGPEAVPLLQKRIIAAANRRRRLVITATQMLESMTHHLRPTRAEASDVANAVFDGTDAVMLSAETAVGAHPVETVQVMDRIVRAAEEGDGFGQTMESEANTKRLSIAEAICTVAASAAEVTDARAIVAFTESGRTARLISKRRPNAPIFAFTPSEAVHRQMALYWGVIPRTMPYDDQPDRHLDEAEHRLAEQGFVNTGDRLVMVSGIRAGSSGGTNSLTLRVAGERSPRDPENPPSA